MDEFIYNALNDLFMSDIVNVVKTFMDSMMTTIKDAVETRASVNGVAMFSACAASLMLIYYFIDIIDRSTKEMITFEYLISSFIKIIISFIILLYIKEIVIGLFDICHSIYKMIVEYETDKVEGIKFFGFEEFPEWEKKLPETIKLNGEKCETVGQCFTALYDDFSNIGDAIGMVIMLLIPSAVNKIVGIASFVLVLSQAGSLLLRAMFAPFGVVQCFEDGQRSSGIKYLKKFTAAALSFALIAAAAWVCSWLTQSILVDALADYNGELTFDNMHDVICSFAILKVVAVQVATIGAMFKTSSIANDVLGV